MILTARVEGLDSLSLKVKYMIIAARQGLKEGVSEAGGIFEQEAKILVPVDSGNLRDAIHTEHTVDTPEVQQQTVTPAHEAGNRYGFDPAYARRIELGFVGQDSLGRNYHQAAQPYMAPAYENKKAEAVAAVKDGIYQRVDAAVGGK